MTYKTSSFKKAAMAIIMLTSSVAFAQNAPSDSRANTGTPSGSFVPADGVVGAGGSSAVSSGVGAGLSTGAIIGGIVIAAVVVSAIANDNKSSNTPSGTTGTR